MVKKKNWQQNNLYFFRNPFLAEEALLLELLLFLLLTFGI